MSLRVQFDYKVYRRPFRLPVRTSRGRWEAREGIVIRVVDENGRTGFGEIAPLEAFGSETLAGAVAWCASVAGAIDRDRLRNVPKGLPCCASALAAALAGGEPRPDPSARLPVTALLPAGDEALAALGAASAGGFTQFKIKIGAEDFATERARLARVVEHLPRGGRLRLDANGGLDGRTAVRWSEVAAEWPVEFLEQPLPAAAVDDTLRLAEDSPVSVALDEAVRGADDIKRWRDRGWRGVFVIKPALAGAPQEWLPEVAIAPAQFVFSSALETAVGAVAGIRLAFPAKLERALGYGVGAFFPADGLGGGVSQPEIAAGELDDLLRENPWNRL